MKVDVIWVVRDANSDVELADILFKTTVDRLPEYVIGTGAATWRAERHTFYTNEVEARADAEKRLAAYRSV